jgi:TIR domain
MKETDPPDVSSAAPGAWRYWAFISYAHSDSRWADWLHRALETYRLPVRLVGRPGPLGPLPRRLAPIFKDREELAGSSNLGEAIADALRQSRFLIVVCSPQSASSRWVSEEVRMFKALAGARRILAVIVGGDPDDAAQDCFGPALREGTLPDERIEPLAADLRPGKDGKRRGLIKLIAAMAGLGFDDLWRREHRRRVRRWALAAGLVLAAGPLYVGAVDGGLNLPSSDVLRRLLDRHELSLFRPIPSETDVRRAASAVRSQLLPVLWSFQLPDGWIQQSAPGMHAPELVDPWTTAQVLYAAAGALELSTADLDRTLRGLDAMFASDTVPREIRIERGSRKLGWIHGYSRHHLAEPSLWTGAAVARTMQRSDLRGTEIRARLESYFRYVEEVADTYLVSEKVGGWNSFPDQVDRDEHSNYATALGLLMLLEARRADVPWKGSSERRDRLIATVSRWLQSQFRAGEGSLSSPGWDASPGGEDPNVPGLTLQISALLLQAEEEVGVRIEPEVLKAIPATLHSAAQYSAAQSDWVETRGVYTTRYIDLQGVKTGREEKETISFLTHPWLTAGYAAWIRRCERTAAPREEVVRSRRNLGELLEKLKREAVSRARKRAFDGAETLMGLTWIPAAIPPTW